MTSGPDYDAILHYMVDECGRIRAYSPPGSDISQLAEMLGLIASMMRDFLQPKITLRSIVPTNGGYSVGYVVDRTGPETSGDE